MKKTTTPLLILTVCISFLACNNKNENFKRRSYHGCTVEANFIASNTIDGVARCYDTSNDLISVVNYKDGVYDGYTTNYYKNGQVRDSMFFVNGLRNGFEYTFDSSGFLNSVGTYYYGSLVGDQIFYSSNKINEYLFTDFNKNDLVSCGYDSNGKCKLKHFDVEPATTGIFIDGKSGSDFLIYFPKPPHLKVTYSMGLTNANHEEKNEIQLDCSNRLFLDTAVVSPEKGWWYYFSSHVENIKDSINKVYINEYRDSIPQ